jgi:formylglycine-generating enzyme required for sulfatase activity
LSNDLEKIRTRVYEITASGPKNQWVERLQTALLPGTSLSVSQRISVGTALSLLGDPRNFWELSVPIGDELDTIYRISKYPITNQQYYEFVQARNYPKPEHWPGDSPPPELRNHPVTFVSWKDATAFCQWLTEEWRRKGQLEPHQAVRLPTIAEWQRAAGADEYPWGNEFDPERCNAAESGIGRTTPMGIYLDGASIYSVLDMAGNVREWVQDSKLEFSQWACSGSWADPKERVKSSFKDSFVPDLRNNRTGFRIVVAPALPEVNAS